MSERWFFFIVATLVCWVPVLCGASRVYPTFVWWKPWTWEKEIWAIILMSPAVNALLAYTAKF